MLAQPSSHRSSDAPMVLLIICVYLCLDEVERSLLLEAVDCRGSDALNLNGRFPTLTLMYFINMSIQQSNILSLKKDMTERVLAP